MLKDVSSHWLIAKAKVKILVKVLNFQKVLLFQFHLNSYIIPKIPHFTGYSNQLPFFNLQI